MKIKIPATSANLGPGFDCLGLAIALYNEVSIKPSTYQSISVKGEGEENVKLKKNNIFVSIFYDVYQELVGKKDLFRFEFHNKIPFSRGMGSSSAVIVGAIASAYEMAGVKASREIILNKALIYETHPDNIAPAVYGGFTSSIVEHGKVKTLKKELGTSLKVVMVIPDRPMSTAHSRTLLPKSYMMKNVVYNLSRASLLSAAFFSENWEYLRAASKDCMHEHRRMKQMRELFDVREIALKHGALMSTLSGSGSSFFNLVKAEEAQKVKEALQKSFEMFRVEIFELDNDGFQIVKS
ncbi:homoserine kinase [Sulfurospirillum barnesii]|uniref:Homoserine kinase n=1 Tax=Sulfurospirillum barnesii (strain ATCC 700032 / DSM 10660 / SES-3) TaxID=760154 RepID=I3XUG7_SULBS|nr:homoserine kinase [Sulfurospirillum barnesii]AFL67591.1 homoserine kinase [Sulfurospirillum barnesii SES-3]